MTTALEALKAYQQADADGVMVLVSRQACDECAAEIERLRDGLTVAYGALLCIGGSDSEWTAYTEKLTNDLQPLIEASNNITPTGE